MSLLCPLLFLSWASALWLRFCVASVCGSCWSWRVQGTFGLALERGHEWCYPIHPPKWYHANRETNQPWGYTIWIRLLWTTPAMRVHTNEIRKWNGAYQIWVHHEWTTLFERKREIVYSNAILSGREWTIPVWNSLTSRCFTACLTASDHFLIAPRVRGSCLINSPM